jgi:hypothetical protein
MVMVRMVPTSRVGIVAYRDQGDEYVTKWTDLSFQQSTQGNAALFIFPLSAMLAFLWANRPST